MTERPLTKLIVGGRQSGKTTKIIEAYNRGDIGKIVVPNVQTARFLVNTFKVMPNDIYTATGAEHLRGYSGEYAIDDFDLFAFTGHVGINMLRRPAIVTMTGEAVVLPDPRKGGSDE